MLTPVFLGMPTIYISQLENHSQVAPTTLIFWKITPEQPMSIISQMPKNGVIFSDGIEKYFLEFNSGTEAKIGVADKRGYLVV